MKLAFALLGLLVGSAAAQQPIPREEPVIPRRRPVPPPPPAARPTSPVGTRKAAVAVSTARAQRFVDLYWFQVNQPQVLQSFRDLVRQGSLPASVLAGFTDLGLAAATPAQPQVAAGSASVSSPLVPPSVPATSIRGGGSAIPNPGLAVSPSASARFLRAPVRPAQVDFGQLREEEVQVRVVQVIAPRDGNFTATIQEDPEHFTIDKVWAHTGSWRPAAASTITSLRGGPVLVPQLLLAGSGASGTLVASAGQPIYIQVRFTSRRGDAGLPRLASQLIVGGNLWQAVVPLRANVTLLGNTTVLSAIPAQPYLLSLRAQRHQLSINLAAIGPGPSLATIHARSAPYDVVVTPITTPIGANGAAQAVVSVTVGGGAPIGEDQPIVLEIVPKPAGLPTTVVLSLSVYEPFVELAVPGVGVPDESGMTVSARFWAKADGTWAFWGEVVNRDEFDDDLLEIGFNVGGGLAGLWYTPIGGTVTGPRSLVRRWESGSSAWLRDSFLSLVSGGLSFVVCAKKVQELTFCVPKLWCVFEDPPPDRGCGAKANDD